MVAQQNLIQIIIISILIIKQYWNSVYTHFQSYQNIYTMVKNRQIYWIFRQLYTKCVIQLEFRSNTRCDQYIYKMGYFNNVVMVWNEILNIHEWCVYIVHKGSATKMGYN